MQNETIVLYTEDKELMREVRRALVKKGFEDDKKWNDIFEDSFNSIHVYEDDIITYHSHDNCGIDEVLIPHEISRTDLLTMFLLG